MLRPHLDRKLPPGSDAGGGSVRGHGVGVVGLWGGAENKAACKEACREGHWQLPAPWGADHVICCTVFLHRYPHWLGPFCACRCCWVAMWGLEEGDASPRGSTRLHDRLQGWLWSVASQSYCLLLLQLPPCGPLVQQRQPTESFTRATQPRQLTTPLVAAGHGGGWGAAHCRRGGGRQTSAPVVR